jgi:hypothetical protein
MKLKLTVEIPSNKISTKSCMAPAVPAVQCDTFSQAILNMDKKEEVKDVKEEVKKDEKEEDSTTIPDEIVLADSAKEQCLLPLQDMREEFPYLVKWHRLGTINNNLISWIGAVAHLRTFCETGKWHNPDIFGNHRLSFCGRHVKINVLWEYLGMPYELQEQQEFLDANEFCDEDDFENPYGDY